MEEASGILDALARVISLLPKDVQIPLIILLVGLLFILILYQVSLFFEQKKGKKGKGEEGEEGEDVQPISEYAELIITCIKPKTPLPWQILIPVEQLNNFYSFPRHDPYCVLSRKDESSTSEEHRLSWEKPTSIRLKSNVPYEVTVEVVNTFDPSGRPASPAKLPGVLKLSSEETRRITYKPSSTSVFENGSLV